MAELLEDWLTIWQSELAGLILDQEMQDAMLRFTDVWAQQNRAALRLMVQLSEAMPDDCSQGLPWTDAAARAAAVAAASDGRDALIGQLLARIEELDRRSGQAAMQPGCPADRSGIA